MYGNVITFCFLLINLDVYQNTYKLLSLTFFSVSRLIWSLYSLPYVRLRRIVHRSVFHLCMQQLTSYFYIAGTTSLPLLSTSGLDDILHFVRFWGVLQNIDFHIYIHIYILRFTFNNCWYDDSCISFVQEC